MKIRISCAVHPDAMVGPAGDALNWLVVHLEDGVFELDMADLYCYGDGSHHELRAEVVE